MTPEELNVILSASVLLDDYKQKLSSEVKYDFEIIDILRDIEDTAKVLDDIYFKEQ